MALFIWSSSKLYKKDQWGGITDSSPERGCPILKETANVKIISKEEK
jgi:hypothetical protein